MAANKILPAGLTAAALVAAIVSAQAQSNDGYDPRSWTYDQARNVLVSPSAPDQTSDEGTLPAWSVIPRQVVNFSEAQPKGSIVINTTERRLYYMLGGRQGTAIRGGRWQGGAGVVRSRFHFEQEGLAGLAAAGRNAIQGSIERPLPAFAGRGRAEQPLGRARTHIGNTLYRVHGTNQPWTVGHANSSGCIRMTNEDVIDLYDRVKIGAQIIVRH
ncbi:hypothetical protein MesoLj131a_20330 [Mesorhizobium sp. 131-2-1]|nr:hypothetical protein MesoLj131a_20330 [Mesorhizobium sp. 131-2-1]